MMRKSRVLLAVGHESISQILRKHFGKAEGFQLIDHEIMHFRFLDEILAIEKPEILVVHDVFLPSDSKTKDEREQEWLSFFHFTRQKFDSLRIVFLCERPRNDIFLNQIVGLGIQDIFNESAIDMSVFISQLSEPPRYANVSKFRDSVTLSAPVKIEGEEIDEEGDEKLNETKENGDSSENKSAEPKEVIVEKEVIKEVVVEKPVEKIVMHQVDKKIILVGSPFERSGSTFVSHLLAKELADSDTSVTYIENPFKRSYTYDRFDGHRKTENYRSIFHSYIESASNDNIHSYEWDVDGVKMIVKHPNEDVYKEDDINFELFIKVLLNTKSTVTIIDIGADWNKDVFRDLFDIASNAFMVFEPDISDIQYLEDPSNKETVIYREYVNNEKTCLIGNRLNGSIKKNKLLQDLYGDKMQITIPSFELDVVFKCQDKAIFLNDHQSSKGMIKGPLSSLVGKIVSDNMHKRKKRKKLFHIF